MASALTPITGSASVTNGSTTVTVVAPHALSALNCAEGAQVFLAGLGYFVASRTDTTHFELERAYEGDTGTVSCSIGQVTPELSQRITLAKNLQSLNASALLIAANEAGLNYIYTGSTAAPAAGQVALDNADPTAATAIRFDKTDLNNQVITDRLLRIASGDELTIRAIDASSRVSYLPTADASDEGSYVEVAVSYQGSDGVLAANGQMVIERQATGPQGPAGTDGTNGTNGTDGADGVIQSIVPGDGITVDGTDPANPVVAADFATEAEAEAGTSETKAMNPLRVAQAIAAQAATATDGPDALIESFRGGTLSDELFTLPNGVNEFDLLKIDGVYYFCQDDKTTTQLMSATTIAGLATATKYAPVAAGRYPTFWYDADTGEWHLWVWSVSSQITQHYKASSFTGAYTLQDSMPYKFADISVRQLSDGNFYAGYKDINPAAPRVGVMVAPAPGGPWINLGYCFADLDGLPPSVGEQADPDIWEADGKTYLTFSAWDAKSSTAGQRPSIVRIDRDTGRAISAPVVLVNALQTWQQANGNAKLFNAVFLREDANPDRIYYSQNVSTTGVAAGWGYLEVGDAPDDARDNADLVNIDFRAGGTDRATGIPAVVHGSGSLDGGGLETTSATGGAYGIPNQADLDGDFTIAVDLTPAALPASGAFALAASLTLYAKSAGQAVGIWLSNVGGTTTVYSELHNPDNSINSAKHWATTITAEQNCRVILTRRGNTLTGYLNGAVDMTDTFSGLLTGFQEWAVANQKGFSAAASQQMQGTVRSLLITTNPAAAKSILKNVA